MQAGKIIVVYFFNFKIWFVLELSVIVLLPVLSL